MVVTRNEVGNLVGNLAGRRFLEHVSYLEDSDVLALQSGHFAALIERNFIDELKDVPRDKLKRLTVSAAGTTSSSMSRTSTSKRQACSPITSIICGRPAPAARCWSCSKAGSD
jgi:hypothetical protein